jgi:fatty-acid desaturase
MSSVAPRTQASVIPKVSKEEEPADMNIPDNYVEYTLKNTKPKPPITWSNLLSELNYLSLAILTITPSIAIYGLCTTKLRWETAAWAVVYYFITGLGMSSARFALFCARTRVRRVASRRRASSQKCLTSQGVVALCVVPVSVAATRDGTWRGKAVAARPAILRSMHPTDLRFIITPGITAGYHRLWAHRSYNASKPLQYFLAMAGAGAVEGSIKWWSRGHRAHHRYTDTDLDPYNAHYGFWWAHAGWMIFKPRRRPGVADVSDLSKSEVVRWQHRWYIYLILGMGFIFPTLVAALFWGDVWGGFFFAGAGRLCFVHHSTFCVNSLAHWLGESPFDDKHTPRDHFITALVTIGEGCVASPELDARVAD